MQFKKLGLSANDMFKVMQSGADNGAWNLYDKIGDAYKELSIRVVDGSDTTAQGFAAIGLNAEQMAQKFARGGESAKAALQQTTQALAAMDDPVQQNIAGVNLFGTMWEDLGATVVTQMASITEGTYGAANAMENLRENRLDDLSEASSTWTATCSCSPQQRVTRSFRRWPTSKTPVLMPWRLRLSGGAESADLADDYCFGRWVCVLTAGVTATLPQQVQPKLQRLPCPR